MKMSSNFKKYLGYILLLLSPYVAFYGGKKQGELECVDFNVLPIIGNSITFILCVTLLILGVILVKNEHLKVLKK